MSSPAIVGVGTYLPTKVRENDDPVFAELWRMFGSHMFDGLDQRRVIGPLETVDDMMVQACQKALADAELAASAVDVILGFGSVGEYITPNPICRVHHRLGLRSDVPVIPVACDFNNFNASLLMADGMIQSGRYRTALIVCGSNWTQYTSLLTPPGAYAGDGAGAVVLSLSDDASRFRFVDMATVAATEDYGQMYMASDAIRFGLGALTVLNEPTYHVTKAGYGIANAYGVDAPIQAANEVLARNGVSTSQITIVPHQINKSTLTAWSKALGNAPMIETMATCADLCCATIPVNIGLMYEQIQTDYLLSLQIGSEMQSTALLMRRDAS